MILDKGSVISQIKTSPDVLLLTHTVNNRDLRLCQNTEGV